MKLEAINFFRADDSPLAVGAHEGPSILPSLHTANDAHRLIVAEHIVSCPLICEQSLRYAVSTRESHWPPIPLRCGRHRGTCPIAAVQLMFRTPQRCELKAAWKMPFDPDGFFLLKLDMLFRLLAKGR